MIERINSVLPRGDLQYPENMVERRAQLIRGFKAVRNDLNIRVKLKLISDTLILFKEQLLFESANKIRAMAVYEKDRLKREKGLLGDGRKMDTV